MANALTLAGVLLSGALSGAGETPPEPRNFFREQIGLSNDQIAMIAHGKAVTKVLESNTRAELIIFGAVFVKATPEEYVRLALNMGWLRRSPMYLAAARFSDPPTLSDLEGFTLEPQDIRDLETCKPGSCGVQLPAEAMQEIQSALDWSGPDVTAQVNSRIQRMALGILQRYKEGGNRVLGSYRDRDHPFDVDAQFRSLLGRSAALPVYLPGLNRYLLDYPKASLSNAESMFFWEKVNFGLKPTLRLNHAIAYRSAGPRGAAHVVAVKQIYASHYFQLALDLTACVTEHRRAGDKGFYLISLKGSTQQGLTGFRGSILRMILASRTRSAQEKLLVSIKKALEPEQ